MTPELCGSFTFWHANVPIKRTWHVWAVLDEDGNLSHIYLSNSFDLYTAQGPLSHSECTHPLYYRAWQEALDAVATVEWSAPGDDDTVIDLFDDPT